MFSDLIHCFFGKSSSKKPSRNAARRSLRFESLESRELLAVTTAEFDAIRSQYADLELSANMADYNVIEITAAELSVAKLKAAITEAGTTTKSDLIVLRTTATQNKITYDSSWDELYIDIDATEYGSVTIVGFGDRPLTIDAAGYSRVLNIGSSAEAALAGVTITGGGVEYWDGDGITITGGIADGGGGIYNGGWLMVTCSTISENSSYEGGGIANEGMLIITNSVISGNSALDYGGGIANEGTLIITNSTISGNTAEYYGGIDNNGTLTVTNCTISGNSALYSCGGIWTNDSMLTLTNSIVALNFGGDIEGELSDESGNNFIGYNPVFVNGPVFNAAGQLTNAASLDLRLTSGSRAVNAGSMAGTLPEYDLGGNPRVYNKSNGGIVDIGAYEFQGPATTPTVISTVVTTLDDSLDPNDGQWSLREALFWATETGTITFAASLAGGTILLNSQLMVNGMNIDGGTSGITLDAQQKSGVMKTSGTVALNNLTLVNGLTEDSGESGGIFNSGVLTVINCTITGNSAVYGGGIYNEYNGWLVITNSTISENTAYIGGGICNYGSLEIINSLISDNTAGSEEGGAGGGIFSPGSLEMTNCMITGNIAGSAGGGIFSQGSLEMTNCMITGNIAGSAGGGVHSDSSLEMTNCTITGNIAGEIGGGIYNHGAMSLYNSIIAANTAPEDSDIFHDWVDEEDNPIRPHGENNLTSFTDWDDSSVNNPVYNPSTPLFVNAAQGDYRIQVGSQARNAGSNDHAAEAGLTAASKDMAGNPRIVESIIDIGAYEYQAAEVVMPPEHLRVTSTGKTAVQIEWNKVTGATQYVLQRKGPGDSDFVTIYTGADAKFMDTGCAVDTTYQYRVQADAVLGMSVFTDAISVKTLATTVGDVPMITGAVFAADNTSATVTWGDLGANYRYQVFRNGFLLTPTAISATSLVDTNPAATSRYIIVSYDVNDPKITQSLPFVLTSNSVVPEIASHTVANGKITLHWDLSGISNIQAVCVYRNGILLLNVASATTVTDQNPSLSPRGNYEYILYVVYQEAGKSVTTFSSTYAIPESGLTSSASSLSLLDSVWSDLDFIEELELVQCEV